MLHRVASHRGRFGVFFALAAVLLIAGGLLRAVASRSAGVAPGSHDMGGMNMSDDEMMRMFKQRLATHPNHPTPSANAVATMAVKDSFTTVGFRWDEDHITSTVIDTAHITAGDAIRFKWTIGPHSATSGTGSLDPDSGLLFDVTMFSAGIYDFQFDNPGTYPFYCVYHEISNMKGVVVVTAPVGAPPIAAGAQRVGFVAAPWPNPTRAGATFRIALSKPGPARLEVLDAQGRRVVTLLDRDLPAGTATFTWDGRRSDGAAAAAGVYMIRLLAPGVSESRRVAIER